MPQVERQNATTVPLGAGDYGRVRESERQVGVTPDQFANTRKVVLAAIELVSAGLEIAKKIVQHLRGEPALHQIGDFGKDTNRDDMWSPLSTERTRYPFMIIIVDVDERIKRRRVDLIRTDPSS